jgi:phosphate uptake regulator
MEVRKVQITGGSTFTVSLPKEWAQDSGIEAGSELTFYPEGETLIATPSKMRDDASIRIDARGLASRELTSRLVTLYVNGFSEIIVEAATIEAGGRRAVRRTANDLVGFEVSSETEGEIVLRDFLDLAELSVHDTVMRMRLLALSMLEDATVALLDGDEELATDVVGRDDDVDRLWYVTSRLFRAALRDPRSAATVGLSREACFDYRSCARQIERIADHSVKIAAHARGLEDLPEDAREPLATLEAASRGVVEDAMDAFLVDDDDRATEIATDALARTERIDEHVGVIDEHLRGIEPADARQLGLIVDSLSRIGDYGGNIAETALQKAAPSPRT